MGFPLKSNFKPGDPTASLQANWLKTVANILNDVKGIGCHIDKPNGGEGMGWQIVIDESASAQGRGNRFLVTDLTGGEIQVTTGIWTRLGIPLALATDVGEEFLTVAGIGANDYVYLKLNASSTDPAIRPTSITVENGGSNPNSGDMEGVYWVLGKFTNSVWKPYWVGDIDDFMVIPDSESDFNVTDPPEDYRYHSLNYAHRSGLHLGNLQIHQWDTPSQEPIVANDLMMFRDTSDNNKQLKYISFEDLGNYLSLNMPVEGEGNLGDRVADDLNSNSKIEHTLLDATNTTRGGEDNSFAANVDHSLVYLEAYNIDSYLNDGRTFRTTGDQWAAVLHASADGTTDTLKIEPDAITALGALAFDIGGAVDFDATSIDMDITAGIDILLESLFNLESISGAIQLKTNAAETNIVIDAAAVLDLDCTDLTIDAVAGAAISTNGTLDLNCEDLDIDALTSAVLSSPVITLEGGAGGIHLDSDAQLDLSPTGILYINGVEALSIADWITKGLLTGPTVVEKTRNQVGPNDKILVIPA